VHPFRIFLLIFFTHLLQALTAQQTDSFPQPEKDSLIKPAALTDSLTKDSLLITDSVSKLVQDSVVQAFQKKVADSLSRLNKERQPGYEVKKSIKKTTGQEILFYALIAMLLFYAVLKLAFPKYFTDLFRVYFRTTLKQTQVREQLLQTPLPSLLLNGFFIVSGGMYAAFLFQHFHVASGYNFWQLWLYSGILLSIIYMMKFAGVWLAGWLMNRSDASAAYTFIVFMNNKITGIVVLPFLVLLAFGPPSVYLGALILSVTVVGCLFLYRFFLSVNVIRNQGRINFLHFLLYLTAFEVVPLLILFKWVTSFLK
jgi:hypothetical protein